MKTSKIVITGGPSTGKTSIINELKNRGYVCFDEISRQVTIEARAHGIEHLFQSDPLLFSEKLLEGRIKQFTEATEYDSSIIFLDRGIPDVLAYMDFVSSEYPTEFKDACADYRYDYVFMLSPWEKIYMSDEVRYENFEEATEIYNHLSRTYEKYGYELIEVPFRTIEKRADFILNAVKDT